MRLLDLAAFGRMKAAIMKAVEGEAEGVLDLALEYIPRDTETAASSGQVIAESETVSVSFGKDDDQNPKTGEASNTYIEALEEDSAAAHPRGGQAHFLKRAVDERRAGMVERIAGIARL